MLALKWSNLLHKYVIFLFHAKNITLRTIAYNEISSFTGNTIRRADYTDDVFYGQRRHVTTCKMFSVHAVWAQTRLMLKCVGNKIERNNPKLPLKYFLDKMWYRYTIYCLSTTLYLQYEMSSISIVYLLLAIPIPQSR